MRFPAAPLPETVSRNRASGWDVLSGGGAGEESALQSCRPECRAGVFGGRGWKGEHCLHARRRRGGDPHGGTWGVVVLRACRASFTENPFGKPGTRG